MFVENHFQKDLYEMMRRDYLKTLTKDELRRSRVHCRRYCLGLIQCLLMIEISLLQLRLWDGRFVLRILSII